MRQQVPAQLPHTFYSGPFAKQIVNAVSMELVQQQLLLLPQQQLLLPAQQPQQLQVVNKNEKSLTESTNII